MGKVLYSVAMSLDGFIAGAGGDMSWMKPYAGPNPVADERMAGSGALLIGANTFRGDDPNRGTEREGAFGGRWQGPQVVVTHHPEEDTPGFTFVPDVATGLERAREGAGDRYVTVLGANIAKQCLELGALDEVLVMIVPVLLGDGVRIFEHPGGTRVGLELLRHSEASLWYRVLS